MWIEIFRTGEHTDASGKKRIFTEEDLKQISSNYNSKVESDSSLEAPLVKGHPKTDEPAFGWIEKLSSKGQRLLAKLKNVSPELDSEIRKGMFKKVSMAIYPDNMLRHVGLLGAFPPAVKGLKNVEFNSADRYFRFSEEIDSETDKFSDLIEYSENISAKLGEAKTRIETLETELSSEQNKYKKEKFLEFAESIELDNHLILSPKYSNELADLLTDISNIDSQYSEKLMDIFDNIQKLDIENNLTQEMNFSAPQAEQEFNSNTDLQRLKLHNRALEHIRNHPEISYEEAIIKSIV